jgi:hypothetical protein
MKSGSKSFGLGVLFVQRKRLLDWGLCAAWEWILSGVRWLWCFNSNAILDPYVVVGLS